MPPRKQDSLYTFNQYLDNKDTLGTRLLENHPWSKKFLSKIFQTNWKSTSYSNTYFDDFISEMDLDNLEKLLQPANIIEASNIRGILLHNYTIDLDALAGTLKVLTLNINILNDLYTLDIPFSTISGKLSNIGPNATYCLDKLLKTLYIMKEVHKNNEEFLISFKKFELELKFVKKKDRETRKNVIDSMFKKYSNIQELNNDNDEKINETVHELTNNLTTNNNQSQIIDEHREDDIENSSNEINTHSDGKELANISDSMLVAGDILNMMLAIDDDDNNIKEIELELNNYITNQFENQLQPIQQNKINTSDSELDNILELSLAMEDTVKNNVVSEAVNSLTINNQSQPIESYQENNIENLQIIRHTHTEEVMQSVEKRTLCYDEHEDLYTHKRQCNNPKLNSDHRTEVAQNEQDSIDGYNFSLITTTHLVGESIYILSDSA
ncbi:hypothetical protein [Orientia tsutsugamushi]|uniref:Repeat-containing protein D n=1 Tax=Orientia tsutsugamushi (strain Boryong) TaxID=357244 RepID=A5CFK9_ORITB|nr:hypothetical protein [Orientia tsutsugamushi]CAM81202.1 hypothetical protein OTBS_2107 [Orientia tsutsugamushi str. Boryong]